MTVGGEHSVPSGHTSVRDVRPAPGSRRKRPDAAGPTDAAVPRISGNVERAQRADGPGPSARWTPPSDDARGPVGNTRVDLSDHTYVLKRPESPASVVMVFEKQPVDVTTCTVRTNTLGKRIVQTAGKKNNCDDVQPSPPSRKPILKRTKGNLIDVL